MMTDSTSSAYSAEPSLSRRSNASRREDVVGTAFEDSVSSSSATSCSSSSPMSSPPPLTFPPTTSSPVVVAAATAIPITPGGGGPDTLSNFNHSLSLVSAAPDLTKKQRWNRYDSIVTSLSICWMTRRVEMIIVLLLICLCTTTLLKSSPENSVDCWLRQEKKPQFTATTSSGGSTTTTTTTSTTTLTSSPLIGVLAQPFHDGEHDYIAASYIKWLEAGGARSIAIPFDADESIIDDILSQVHAIFLPGGGSKFPNSVKILLDKVLAFNTQEHHRRYLPVWGTCLGFQFMIQYVGGIEALEIRAYESENVSLPLEEVKLQELYADPVQYTIVTTQNVTMNNHHDGISPERFLANSALNDVWEITSTNVDDVGRSFVSTMEPKHPDKFPFYATQYHPEKNAFEYSTFPNTDIPYEAINHSQDSIDFSLWLARWWVDKARQGMDQANYTTVPVHDPYVYTYPIKVGVKFEQIYLLPKADAWKSSSLTDKSAVVNDADEAKLEER